MAWIFSLSAECGPRKEAAEEFARHFRGFAVDLPDGSSHRCDAGTTHYLHGGDGWWSVVTIDGVMSGPVQAPRDEKQLTEFGNVLYERLRSAPPFRYALVGVEVDEFRDFHELDDDVVKLDFSGLVLSDAVWEHLHSPPIFVPFVPGYRWRPFIRAR